MSVTIEDLSFIYDEGSPFETRALDKIDLTIKSGEFIGLIGHTGSGKSTLIQHLNGLKKPTNGRIFIDGIDITVKGVKLTDVRKKVGLVFQYPEYQLFEETVEKDIAFGPTQLGLESDQIKIRVLEAMKLVGLDYDQLGQRSPFELSGGQRRRIAIAGVLAMKPEVLVLDEPTAGLDPRARDEILDQIKALHQGNGNTVILVSHSMEDVSKYVDRLLVMESGRIVLDGTAVDVFKERELLLDIGLGVPQVIELKHQLRKHGFDLGDETLSLNDAKEKILALIRRKKC